MPVDAASIEFQEIQTGLLIQPSQERVLGNVGVGGLISQQEFDQELRNPNTELWFRGQKQKLGGIEPKDALEAVGVWMNGDLILAVKNGYARKVPPYYNFDRFGLGTEEEFRKRIADTLTLRAQPTDLEYISENIGIRGEAYTDPKTGLILIRIYSHEGQAWESKSDKEHTVFHEIGHGVYNALTPEERSGWEQLYEANPDVRELARTIKEARRNLLDENLREETFADSFATLAAANEEQQNNYRKNYPDLCQLLRRYVKI